GRGSGQRPPVRPRRQPIAARASQGRRALGTAYRANSADIFASPDRAQAFVFRLAYRLSQDATAPFNMERARAASSPIAADKAPSVSYFCSSRSFLTNSTLTSRP